MARFHDLFLGGDAQSMCRPVDRRKKKRKEKKRIKNNESFLRMANQAAEPVASSSVTRRDMEPVTGLVSNRARRDTEPVTSPLFL